MMESKRQWWKHTKWNEHLNTQMKTLMVTIKTFHKRSSTREISKESL